jgi:hypothetical protein
MHGIKGNGALQVENRAINISRLLVSSGNIGLGYG